MAQTAVPQSVLNEAHKFSSAHRQYIERSQVCGCFYCLSTFPPSEIEDWIDEPNGGNTAICPKCGVDAVIGNASGYDLNHEFLSAMHHRWFER